MALGPGSPPTSAPRARRPDRAGLNFWLSARAAQCAISGGRTMAPSVAGIIWVGTRTCARAVPVLVAAYIGAAYRFTASTSFANPAVTIARAMTNTFAGIRPADVPGFLIAQSVGAITAVAIFGWLEPVRRATLSRDGSPLADAATAET